MDDRPDELIPTRATLLARLKNWQDDSSWQDFFDTYWKLIYGVARKSGLNDAEAQDVVQETMVAVARHIPGFEYDRNLGSFKAWLFNLTRWRVADAFRRRKSPVSSHPAAAPPGTTPHADLVNGLPDPASNALDQLWDAEWEHNLLAAATAKVKRQLDPQKYQVFDFYVNKDWPAGKVAGLFGISVDQVYLAKHRVTDLIKQEVTRLQKDLA